MNVDLSGLDRLKAKFNRLGNFDATPLMATWMQVITDDNRKGVLAGTDKDGKLMPPVTYRPVGKVAKIGAKGSASMRNDAKARSRAGKFAGFGMHSAGVNNNLTSAQYRSLDGPPLAPRRQFSRVITNLRTAYERIGFNQWTAYGFWFEVVDRKGRPFLGAHFRGSRAGRGAGFRLKARDLRGVRPEGRAKARRAAIAWMSDQIRWLGGRGAA